MTAAHEVYVTAMAEARIRFELAFEKLEAMTPSDKAHINWGHAGSASRLLELTKTMCKELLVSEEAITEGYCE